MLLIYKLIIVIYNVILVKKFWIVNIKINKLLIIVNEIYYFKVNE